eukprot:jgi/Tetstr1/424902/TSEL_015397.t1
MRFGGERDKGEFCAVLPAFPLGMYVDCWRWARIMDLDVPSWRMWVSRCLAGRCHSRTAAFLASGTVFALHKDDPASRARSGRRPASRYEYARSASAPCWCA